jgi:diguanylate cyclase (GGDEF)-like protein
MIVAGVTALSDHFSLPTVMFVVLMINILNVILFSVMRIRMGGSRAFNWWLLAAWFSAAWAGINGLMQFAPGFLTLFCAPALYVTATGFGWLGYRSFFGRDDKVWAVFVGPALVLAVYLLGHDTKVRLALSLMDLFLCSAVYLLLTASILKAGPSSERLQSAKCGARLFTIFSLCNLVAVPLDFVFPVRMEEAAPQSVWLFVMILILMIHTIATAFMTVFMVKERGEKQLLHLANTDVLTGLKNRRAFIAGVEKRLATSAEEGSYAVIDLDHFKAINDTYGHPAGDAVLRAFAAIMKTTLPENVILGRMGGEEFAFYASGYPSDACYSMAENIRAKLEVKAIIRDKSVIRVTTSIGIAERSEILSDIDQMSAAADSALYLAKASGRNRVCSANGLPEASAAMKQNSGSGLTPKLASA